MLNSPFAAGSPFSSAPVQRVRTGLAQVLFNLLPQGRNIASQAIKVLDTKTPLELNDAVAHFD
jgi:hypothetical protein